MGTIPEIQILVGILDGRLHCQIAERHNEHILFEKSVEYADPQKEAINRLYKIVPELSELKEMYNKDNQPIVAIREGVKMEEGNPTLVTCDKLSEKQPGMVWLCFCSFFTEVGMELMPI